MKVAVIFPASPWSTRDIALGYADALARIGHEVLRADLWQYGLDAAGVREPRHYAKALAAPARREALRRLLDMLRASPLDWAVAVHGDVLPVDLPDDLRRRGTRSALLLTDEPYETGRSLVYAKGWDLVVTNDPATLEAHRTGHANAHYLSPGFDPAVMRPDPDTSPAYDTAFVGTWFKERVRFFEALWDEIAPRPHLLAGYWFRPEDALPAGDMPGDTPMAARVRHAIVWPAELCRVYQRTRVSLNLHRGSLWHANPAAVVARGVNPRLFEIAGCGAFQLVDARDQVRQCFSEDEVETFRDAEEARSKLREWLDPRKEAERRKMAARALKRALTEHTYLARAGTLTEWMG